LKIRKRGHMVEIHPSAVVSPHAELAPGVTIGPYSIIGDQTSIGRDTVIGSHVVIEGNTKIGKRNRIFPFVTIGTAPQDIGYKGEDTRVVIGDDNVIRECVTINRATTKEEWVTVVGNKNYIMTYSHIAHDCHLGNEIMMSNLATLAGHITIGDYANISGMVAAQQFVRIGAYSYIGGRSSLRQDVPPFMIASGERAKLYGVNQKGLQRVGCSNETIDGLKKAYKIIWRSKVRLSEGISQVRQEIKSFPELEMLLDFFNGSKRGITR
jgi:UDP-N-acetylglucosamine acyltransferase